MTRAYLRPIPTGDPALRGANPRLAGGWARIDRFERLVRGQPAEVLPVTEVAEEELARFTAPRAELCGLSMAAPRLMGILNVTPDSFSDGGLHAHVDAAVARAKAMVDEGADILDVGGESTRPGALEVDAAAEIDRVQPVLSAMKAAGIAARVSLDTRKAAVGAAGLAVGAQILNDVSGLRHDPNLAQVAAEAEAPLILMHSIGTPDTMQELAETAYTDVLLDAYDALEAAVAKAEAAGVPRHCIVVDPGIGFGKTLEQNLALLKRLSLFHGLGVPVLLGVSRKGLIGKISGVADAAERGPGSAALGLWALSQGIQILRVHDISVHKQAMALWQSVAAADQ